MMNNEVLDAPAALQVVDAAPAQGAIAPRQQTAVSANPSPADLVRFAMQAGGQMDMERMERLMAMQVAWKAGEAKEAFNEAHAAFKGEAVEIIKRKRVTFTTQKGTTDYKHAELSDVVDALAAPLSKHGFSWKWTVTQKPDWIEVTCTLTHKAGHSESVTLGGPPDASGGKNTIQSIISTKTYLERHTLKAIAGVAEKGEDDDGAGGSTETDITDFLLGLGATANDDAAAAYWNVNKGLLQGEALAKFKAAVVAHRMSMKGAAK